MLNVIAEIEKRAYETDDYSRFILVEDVLEILRDHASNPAPQQVGGEGEREAFEAWADPLGYSLAIHARGIYKGDYIGADTDFAWKGWQARSALQPAPQVAAGGEQVTRIELADAYYAGFQNLPEDIKKRLSLYQIREIFKHMVAPAMAI